MISHKRWIHLSTAMAFTGALMALPAATFAHGIPPAAAQHQKQRDTAPDPVSTPTTLSGQISVMSREIALATSNGMTYQLRFGPPWYVMESALASANGQTATITGKLAGHSLHVRAFNGKTLRGHGKPPWAGLHGHSG